MSAALPPPVPPAPARPVSPPRVGRLVAGVLLMLVGIGWLLEVLGVSEVPWDVLLPAALIVIGVALVLVSRAGGSQAGLITTGVVLSVLLLLGSAIDIPLRGGIGDREERPASVAALRDEYRLGIGRLTLDLTAIDPAELDTGLPPISRVRVRVGIGQVEVIVPEGVLVEVAARAGLGDVNVFGAGDAGFDAERVLALRGGVDLELVVSVGLGDVEVRRG
jgi:hypothetical protein